MSSRRVRTASVLVVLLIAALTLPGCGRLGKLEPPPNPNAPPKNTTTRSGIQTHARIPKIVPPNDSFILDPLL